MEYINDSSKNYNYSTAFQKIMNKYLKAEKKKRFKFEFMKNPSQILIDEICNKKRKIKFNEDDVNNIISEDRMDFDTYKYFQYNKKKIKKQYKSVNKNIYRYLFLNQKKIPKENEKNNNFNKYKIIKKSLSQNLYPSITNYHNEKILKFPKILKTKKMKIKNNYNNLLIKTKENSNLISINNHENRKDSNIPKETLTLKEHHNSKKLILKKSNTNLNFYTSFNSFNKRNYYDYYKKLNLLTDKSKEILKQLNYYSSKQNFFINKEKEKTNLLNTKFNKKEYLSDL